MLAADANVIETGLLHGGRLVDVAQIHKRIAEMEAELAEFAHRQRLLDDEMIKAEAQIDLIKDVLLREPGI